MQFDLYPYGKPFNMLLSIRIIRPVKLSIVVFDPDSKRVYLNRRLQLKKSRRVLLKLPIVPNELTAEILDQYLGSMQKSFVLEEIKLIPDTKCPLELTKRDKQFIRFAKWFSTEASRLEAGEKGTIYQNEGFSILYVDRLTENGIELTTPARIARDTGVIEISKSATNKYTVPMLIVMLLHEYAHKWKNAEYGRKVSNELCADLIAIHIALNLGFDPKEVENCFRLVFAKRDSKLNRKRMMAIREFIALFLKSESTNCKRR